MSNAGSHSERAHATLGASSASRWMACPGSVNLSEGMAITTSEYAKEGTAAHELAELCFSLNKPASAFIEREINGIIITEEMAESVQVFIDAVLKVAEGNRLFVEQRFSLAKLNPPAPMFGTADAVVWDEKAKTLYVFDLKYGAGVPVKVDNSPQLSYYALGAMLALEEQESITPENVVMCIVQPRYNHPDGPVRWFGIDSFTLSCEWAVDLIAAAHRTLEDDAPIVSGEHCRFCPAQAKCPELHKQAVELAQTEFDDNFSPPMPEVLSDEQISQILDKAGLFTAWLNSVKTFATEKMQRGGAIPGYKLVARRATRKWDESEDIPAMLASLGLDEDDMYVKKLISPAQAEGVLGNKKAVKERIKSFTVSESSGNTLAPLSDKRPAVVVMLGDEFDETPTLEYDEFSNYE